MSDDEKVFSPREPILTEIRTPENKKKPSVIIFSEDEIELMSDNEIPTRSGKRQFIVRTSSEKNPSSSEKHVVKKEFDYDSEKADSSDDETPMKKRKIPRKIMPLNDVEPEKEASPHENKAKNERVGFTFMVFLAINSVIGSFLGN